VSSAERLLVTLVLTLGCADAPKKSTSAFVSASPPEPPSAQPQLPSAAPAPTAQASSHASLAAVPDAQRAERLREDVRAFSVVRPPGSPGWAKSRARIVERVESLGWRTTEERFEAGGVNVLAERAGTTKPDEVVILSAHYDHVPFCLGADDNASGVAAVLEAARFFRSRDVARTLRLGFWDREETGLEGSLFHASEAKRRGEKLRVAISLDGVGFASSQDGSQRFPPGVEALLPDVFERARKNSFRANFLTALGDTDALPSLEAFERAGESVGLLAFGVELGGLTRLALQDAARSDHASFWLHGYPGVLVTDTANFRNPRYHCGAGQDDPESLDYQFLERAASTVIGMTLQELDAP
jgi:hypothetical protein